MTAMITEMARDWKNLTIDKLKHSEDLFSDSKPKGFASVFEALSKAANNKILKKYSDEKIEKIIGRILENVDKKNQELMYGKAEEIIGISQKQLAHEENLKGKTASFIFETKEWVKKLRDDTLQEFSTNALRAMSLGQDIDFITKQFDGFVGKRKDHAKFVARTQVATFNSLMTKVRAQNLGVTKAVWITGGDERVRKAHKERDGKEFELSKGCYSSVDKKWLLPGTDYQCRCTYELILD